MKITKLETIRIEERPNLLWLHVHTDEGIIGLMEINFLGLAPWKHIFTITWVR